MNSVPAVFDYKYAHLYDHLLDETTRMELSEYGREERVELFKWGIEMWMIAQVISGDEYVFLMANIERILDDVLSN